ncbi:alpha/beta hydrolase [Campylobacter geochelonis]|uniref:alpha/beta hydrolase n=1 Tax=Campylobacter geochelonis TaxID=1780362 RepID=UPI000770A0FB|nr:alpha/beta fold hydrolase [Campylobacter geochelonis]CZE51199.1 hydrolase with alpha/beta fold [Campylobacter geochelonis]
MKTLKRVFFIAIFVYIATVLTLFLFQEKLIFVPTKVDTKYKFNFDSPFKELNLKANDGAILNGVVFKAKKAKGAVLFFHGNAGWIKSWENAKNVWLELGYDFYLFDYRGYGKSGGKINSEKELFIDAKLMLNEVLKDFKLENIIVVGHSLGTGIAAKTACDAMAKNLVLLSPYYSFENLAKEIMPFVPKFTLKYKIKTADFLQNCQSRINIFHGKNDELIKISHSQNLSKFLKPNDKIYLLNASHNDIFYNQEFLNLVKTSFK